MNSFAPLASPQLDLGFSRHGARTVLSRKRYGWPFVLTRSFHLDLQPAHMASVILQTGAGAIHGEDRLVQRIAVGPDAAAHVTTQGATSVHRADREEGSSEALDLRVAAGGVLEYLPEARILFAGAAMRSRVTIAVEPGGLALVADAFTSHDPGGSGAPFRSLRSEIAIHHGSAEPVAIERFLVTGGALQEMGISAHGSLYLVSNLPQERMQALAGELTRRLEAVPELYGAASVLPQGCGLVLRFTATELRALRAGLQLSWRFLRRELFGCDPGARPG